MSKKIENHVIDATEPDVILVNDIEIIKPTARFPIGQYILLGPNVGVMFPSIPVGPKGTQMGQLFEKLAKKIVALQKQALEAVKDTGSMEQESLVDYLTEISEDSIALFRVGMLINYTEAITDWVIENIPLDIQVMRKINTVCQGDVVDADTFSGQSGKV